MTGLVGDSLVRDQRTFVLALLVSVTVHTAVLVFGPGLRGDTVPPEPLTVTLAPEPAPVEPPQPLPPAPPPPQPEPKPKPQPEPPKKVREPRPEPTREPVITREETAEPAAPAVTSPPPVAPPEPEPEPAPPAPAPPRPAPPPVVTAPEYRVAYLTNPKPPYPAFSRRRGEEGTVRLNVLVTAEGRAARVELAHSSGFDALDRSALRTVQDWRFKPARRGEEAVEAWVEVPIIFRLRD